MARHPILSSKRGGTNEAARIKRNLSRSEDVGLEDREEMTTETMRGEGGLFTN